MRGSALAAVLALSCISACGSAGGGAAAIGSGFAGALPDAQMKWACVDALKRELAGGPPAPAICQSAPGQSWAPSSPQQQLYDMQQRRMHCDTRSYYSINGVPQYQTDCY